MAGQQTRTFSQRLDEINNSFIIAADDFVETVAREINTQGTSLNLPQGKTIYNSHVSDLENIISNLFVLKGEVLNSIYRMATDIISKDDKITSLKQENQELEAQLSSISDKSAGATGRYDDARKQSYMEFYRTILLLVAGYFAYKQMKSVIAPAVAQVSSVVSEATAKLPSIPKPDINIAALKPNL